MESITLTPNYARMFAQMIQEAARQGDARGLFGELPQEYEVEALRAMQRFFAPLTIAANSATSVAEVEMLREVMTGVLTAIDKLATELENDLEEHAPLTPDERRGLL